MLRKLKKRYVTISKTYLKNRVKAYLQAIRFFRVNLKRCTSEYVRISIAKILTH